MRLSLVLIKNLLCTALVLLISTHSNATPSAANYNHATTLVQDIKTIAHGDPEQAIVLWQSIVQQQHFSLSQWLQVSEAIGMGFANAQDIRALQWLGKLPTKNLHNTTHIARVKSAIRHGNWSDVAKWITAMPINLQQQQIWKYWHSRALIKLGSIHQARTILLQLANNNSYYGVLARHFLPYQDYMPPKSTKIPQQHILPILHIAKNNDLDPAWILAIAKKESTFNANAASAAGAIGLMQLLPSTAVMLAKNTNITLRNIQDLYNPNINLALGVKYLKQLLRQQQQHPILATAAYNAGPTRVKRWLPAKGTTMPADIWIEFIPYKETRHFVKTVITYSSNYQNILGSKISLKKYLEPIANIS
ncbi:MAG: hypothetical protein COB50_03575 [Thiotrichales bacterium]|nr:MAG: hypothetical protein COB50_03575 [Thiotrichales bacterium]